MKVKYLNFKEQWLEDQKNLLPIIKEVFSSGQYVGSMNKRIIKLEENISKICNTKYCTTLNSGTDALTMALFALGIKKGDEVITPPNSYIASTGSIVHLGAKPVFVDVQDDLNIDPYKIENAITSKTKAIMPVHLTGRVCEMNKIIQISKKYNIPIVEDCAQSFSSKYYNKICGSFGKIGCFSAHPLKNLNAMGDAGFITTSIKEIAKKIKRFGNHGLITRDKAENFGYVSRMDIIQAAIIDYRLKKYKNIVMKRRKNANYYFKNLDINNVFFSTEKKYQFNTYHTFIIQVNKRDYLIKNLKEKGIDTYIHYPIPIHLQKAAKKLGYKKGDFPITEKQSKKILSLPIHQHLSENQLDYVCNEINKFYKK